MKITKVTPYPFFAGPKNLMLCRVDTDEGVYGWGEAYVVQGKEKAVQQPPDTFALVLSFILSLLLLWIPAALLVVVYCFARRKRRTKYGHTK